MKKKLVNWLKLPLRRTTKNMFKPCASFPPSFENKKPTEPRLCVYVGVGVRTLPNKDLTSVQTAPANPAKTVGKKWAIFVPQLSHVLIVQRTTRILSVSCYCITQSNSLGGSAGPWKAAEGCSPRMDPSPLDTKGSWVSDLKNGAGETTNLEAVASIYHEGGGGKLLVRAWTPEPQCLL